MRPRTVIQYEDRLRVLFDKATSISDDEIRAHWAKYLCVLTCGFLEVAIPAIYAQYVSVRATPEITRHVQRRLKVASPQHEKILQMIGSFDAEWEADIRQRTVDEIKDHIDSLVANRHLIAHGQDTGVTIARVREWFESTKALVKMMESQCGL